MDFFSKYFEEFSLFLKSNDKVPNTNIGIHVNILYTYLYSQNTGEANVVSHNINIGIYANNCLYFFVYIEYIKKTTIIQNANPILKNIDIIGKSLFSISESILCINSVGNLGEFCIPISLFSTVLLATQCDASGYQYP